jgi:hypothetical protein
VWVESPRTCRADAEAEAAADTARVHQAVEERVEEQGGVEGDDGALEQEASLSPIAKSLLSPIASSRFQSPFHGHAAAHHLPPHADSAATGGGRGRGGAVEQWQPFGVDPQQPLCFLYEPQQLAGACVGGKCFSNRQKFSGFFQLLDRIGGMLKD